MSASATFTLTRGLFTTAALATVMAPGLHSLALGAVADGYGGAVALHAISAVRVDS